MAQVPTLHSFPHAAKQADKTGMWYRARQRVKDQFKQWCGPSGPSSCRPLGSHRHSFN